MVPIKIDKALQAEYVSPSMADILGYTPEYFIGNGAPAKKSP
jgi:hypothetical protein